MLNLFNQEKENESDLDIKVENNSKSKMDEHYTGKIKKEKGNIQFVNIIGQIEGHMVLPPDNKSTKYEHIIPLLIEMSEDDEIDGLIFILNTVGGDVEAGLAIAELISTIGKPTVSLVLGGGHSIGVPLAVSTDYSFIAKSATMMLHPVRVNGLVIGSKQTYQSLNKTQERIFDFIVENSAITMDKLKDLMFRTDMLASDIGTILYGKEAVNTNLINEVGGLDCAMKKLYELIESKNSKK
ncbi:MAG: ClpP family protease [Lachnospirales bacterium]